MNMIQNQQKGENELHTTKSTFSQSSKMTQIVSML